MLALRLAIVYVAAYVLRLKTEDRAHLLNTHRARLSPKFGSHLRTPEPTWSRMAVGG